jgi:ATP-dependent helicase Lhr and Lhr-like helicase
LRGLRRSEEPTEALSVVTADPLNLAGILLPGPRVSALAGGTVALVGAAELVAAGRRA